MAEPIFLPIKVAEDVGEVRREDLEIPLVYYRAGRLHTALPLGWQYAFFPMSHPNWRENTIWAKHMQDDEWRTWDTWNGTGRILRPDLNYEIDSV